MGLKVDYKFCPQCRNHMTRTAEGDPHCAQCDITVYNNVVGWFEIEHLPEDTLTHSSQNVRDSLRDLQVWYRKQAAS